MSETPRASQREPRSDDEWKERVRAEASEGAGGLEGSGTEPGNPAPVDFERLPRPDFTTLVGMFSTQAMVALGMLPDPEGGSPEQHPELARHFIDLLSVVEKKTRGNLTTAEERFLKQSLHELRIAFVESQRRAGA